MKQFVRKLHKTKECEDAEGCNRIRGYYKRKGCMEKCNETKDCKMTKISTENLQHLTNEKSKPTVNTQQEKQAQTVIIKERQHANSHRDWKTIEQFVITTEGKPASSQYERKTRKKHIVTTTEGKPASSHRNRMAIKQHIMTTEGKSVSSQHDSPNYFQT